MSNRPVLAISDDQVERYHADGAIMLPGLFDMEWVERLRRATDRVIDPEYAYTQSQDGFSRSRNMWMHDEDFRAFVFESPAAAIAQRMMRVGQVRFYFDHLFVKEPGTQLRTPWHQDMPYWPVSGGQVTSIWLALDAVTRESSGLVYVRGSHLEGKAYKPVTFTEGKTAQESECTDDMPDYDANPAEFDFQCWDMQPGDCLVHDSYVVHGAAGNSSSDQRRRALSTRWAEPGVVFDPRPGQDGLLSQAKLKPGDKLSGADYPVVPA